MLTELRGKGGRVCREARKGNIRCGLIVRPTSEDVITGHLAQAFRTLNPRWWLPDILNIGLKARRFRRQVYRSLRVEPWRNRPRYPRELLPWEEGSTQVDLSVQWENPPTMVYFEVKYLAQLSPRVTNGEAGFPSDQLIRNIRVGLLECGWFCRNDLIALPPRDFVLILLSPCRGNELVAFYQKRQKLMAAIPHSDRLIALPKTPFIGELTYGDIIRVLQRQRDWFKERADALIVTGDIAESRMLGSALTSLPALTERPVYFVLGNHDFYQGSIAATRRLVNYVVSDTEGLVYLSQSGVVELTPSTALVGHDG
jgi:hypothetical protein